jgi:hypothetical protein
MSRIPNSGLKFSRVIIQERCPGLRSLKFVYDIHGRRPSSPATEELGGHLASLGGLADLRELAVTSADFYSHSVFSLLRTGISFAFVHKCKMVCLTIIWAYSRWIVNRYLISDFSDKVVHGDCMHYCTRAHMYA